MLSINYRDIFSWKSFSRSKSECKICKDLLIKLLIFSKMGLYDVANLTESVLETLQGDFRALPREI